MRLHKVVNRVYHGTTYYRWVVSIPPKEVRNLGWVDGQRLDLFVHGSSLTLQPSRAAPPHRGAPSSEAMREIALDKAPRRATRSS